MATWVPISLLVTALITRSYLCTQCVCQGLCTLTTTHSSSPTSTISLIFTATQKLRSVQHKGSLYVSGLKSNIYVSTEQPHCWMRECVSRQKDVFSLKATSLAWRTCLTWKTCHTKKANFWASWPQHMVDKRLAECSGVGRTHSVSGKPPVMATILLAVHCKI